jgi:hypothetical protein
VAARVADRVAARVGSSVDEVTHLLTVGAASARAMRCTRRPPAVLATAASTLLLVLPLVLAPGCGDDDGSRPDGSTDYGTCVPHPFSVSPVAIADIRSIAPLGNLNPPGHVMPTEHMYVYLRLAPGGEQTVVTPLHAPCDLTVTMARATEHVHAGFVDFALTGAPCNDLTLVLGHVSSLEESLFGDTTTLEGWQYDGEYDGGDEIYRGWVRWFEVGVTAGARLGTAGGHPGQWALDVGVFDLRTPSGTTANPARWRQSSLHAACMFDLFADGPVRDSLVALLDREPLPADPTPCGAVHQDVVGTAHGAWFLAGTPNQRPEDNHLALVWHSTRPSMAAISVGRAVPTLDSNVYAFTPADTGRLNRTFTAVTPGPQPFGYAHAMLDGVVLVQLPVADTLWIERIAASPADPESWVFTDRHSVFAR